MQPILRTDPYYVDQASKENRLFLTRTKGSLSGGTKVRVVESDPEYTVLKVAAKVKVKTQTAPNFKYVDEIVMVTLEDLVIQRMKHHPDMPAKNRRARRIEKAAQERVLAQLKERTAANEGS